MKSKDINQSIPLFKCQADIAVYVYPLNEDTTTQK